MNNRFNELVVLEMTDKHYHSAYAGRLLGEIGARVIEIEPLNGSSLRNSPPFKNGVSLLHSIYQANKESVCIDLPKRDACDIVLELAKRADIILDGMGIYVANKWGIDYEVLKKSNPRLIYASLTTYGVNGLYSEYDDHEVLAQARGGIMSLTGMKDGPPMRASTIISDLITGLHAAICCVATLYHRDATGKGQFIDMANFDTIATHLKEFTTMYLVEKKVLKRMGNLSPRVAPYNAYRCKDGYAVIATASNPQWESLARAIGREDLICDPNYKTPYDRRFKGNNVTVLDNIIEGWTKDRYRQDVVDIMNRAHVPCAPVQEVSSVLADEHLWVRDMFIKMSGSGNAYDCFPGSMLKLSATKGTVSRPGEYLGMSTGKVLRELLGYSDEALQDLLKKSIIWGAVV